MACIWYGTQTWIGMRILATVVSYNKLVAQEKHFLLAHTKVVAVVKGVCSLQECH